MTVKLILILQVIWSYKMLSTIVRLIKYSLRMKKCSTWGVSQEIWATSKELALPHVRVSVK